VIHLAAIAGRVGLRFDLNRLNALSDSTPVLVGVKPVGTEHYMEDFFAAGGIGAVLRELKPLLHLDCMTISGETVGERLAAEEGAYVDRRVVKSAADPLEPQGGLVALFGSLAPDGAILKRSAATRSLFETTGRAVVFSSLQDMAARIDDPALDVAPEDFIILQNAGPRSAAAMPEAGFLPIPKKLLAAGVKDMVRISDARMSGTAYGTSVLHVAPEAAVGGPLALVRSGDRIRLSVKERRIDLLVEEAELARRRDARPTTTGGSAMVSAPAFAGAEGLTPSTPQRGYDKLFRDSVMQAPDGCDFDFLRSQTLRA
jgi:dihydroxy-acid dehydratase